MASWGQSSTAYPSQASSNPNQPSRGGSAQRGGGRGRGRGGGAGGAGRKREEDAPSQFHLGLEGDLQCGHLEPGQAQPCAWRTSDANALTLHRADRHLIMPPGGKEELDRIDPIAREERKEMERKARRQARLDGSDEDEEAENPVISGLNITLSTPELVSMWVRERRKRWPSAAVVEQKRKEAWDQNSTGRPMRNDTQRPSKRARIDESALPEAAPPTAAAPKQVKAAVNDASDDSDSDDDGPPEAVSSRPDAGAGAERDSQDSATEQEPTHSALPAPKQAQPASEGTMARPGAPICRFWQQGRCNYGAQCKSQHAAPAPSSHAPTSSLSSAAQQQARPRPRPKAPPPNAFQAPHLLRALLANEIAQHVDAVAQTIRFIVRNDGLRGVELSAGEAEEQSRRRGLVQLVKEDAGTEGGGEREEEEQLGEPVVQGALPTLSSSSTPGASTLFRPASPTLRPLTSLSYPPEPDPLIFLDPLRAADPKPLRREQILQLATDAQLRSLLFPSSSQAAHGEHASMPASLARALETHDALPSSAHRISALELILGVSEQSPLHAHQHGSTFVRPHPSGGSRARPIGEVELFRLGLRVGPDEVQVLRSLAQRVSEITGGVEFSAETDAWKDVEEGKDAREAMRRREWEKEADKRDLLRSLGVEVD